MTPHERRERRVAVLAAGQHGTVASWQLLDAGLSRAAISRRVRQGRLHRIHRGVYSVGHPLLSAQGVRMSAILACGPDAVLSHTSAAGAWGLLAGNSAVTHVTVPNRDGSRGSAGVRVHRKTTLALDERTVIEGLPVTTVSRTLVDLGDVVPAAQVRRAFINAEQARLLDMRTVETALGRALRLPGARALREILKCYDPQWQMTRSTLELMMLDLLSAAGLPAPVVNELVGGRFMVDFLWRERALVVETDGERVHGTATARREDARRDRDLSRLGYRVVRFSYAEVHNARRRRSPRRWPPPSSSAQADDDPGENVPQSETNTPPSTLRGRPRRERSANRNEHAAVGVAGASAEETAQRAVSLAQLVQRRIDRLVGDRDTQRVTADDADDIE